MNTKQLSATLLVVLLTDLMVNGDMIPVATVLEVERGLRNDWKGSGLCRDATDEEIAEYRAEEGAADGFDEQLQLDQAQLIADIEAKKGELEGLQERKAELAGDLEALESDIEDLGKQHTAAQAELAELANQKKALADEVAALEKAKKAASK